MFRYFAPKLLKILCLTVIILVFLVLGNIYTYQRLTHEEPIAQLTFSPVSNQEYDATLRLGNLCKENTYRIYGDEWRIDSQFLKWKSWATLFGLNAMYRIDRLSGRYTSVVDENSKLHSAHDLKSTSTIDLAKIAERYDNSFPPVDTVYGSSAYKAMKPNILYSVYVTQSGILIRDQVMNDLSHQNNCVDDTSKWKDTILNLDNKLAGLITNMKSLRFR